MAISLLGYYCFNDNDTSTVRDFSVQGVDSASVTGLTISTDAGAIGKVGVFDGTTTYISLGDLASFDSLTGFSIVCKFKTDLIGNRQCLSYRASHHLLEITAGGDLKITLVGGSTRTLEHSEPFVAGVWYTVIMTWATTTIDLYINSINEHSTSVAASITLNNNSNSIQIGFANPDIFFDGQMEMISYYNRVFLTEEIESALENASGLKYEIMDAKIQTGDLIITNSGGREICIWSEEFDERLFSDDEDHLFDDETAMMF